MAGHMSNPNDPAGLSPRLRTSPQTSISPKRAERHTSSPADLVGQGGASHNLTEQNRNEMHGQFCPIVIGT